MKKGKKAKNLEEVSKDIIGLRFKKSMTLSQVLNSFYDIMRKHGIKQGTKSKKGAGVTCNNFEWSMCWILFLNQIESHFQMESLIAGTPRDLYHY